MSDTLSYHSHSFCTRLILTWSIMSQFGIYVLTMEECGCNCFCVKFSLNSMWCNPPIWYQLLGGLFQTLIEREPPGALQKLIQTAWFPAYTVHTRCSTSHSFGAENQANTWSTTKPLYTNHLQNTSLILGSHFWDLELVASTNNDAEISCSLTKNELIKKNWWDSHGL